MQPDERGTERRRSYRVRLRGVRAHLWCRDGDGMFPVCDLSIGGALLEGTPVAPPGARLMLRLHLTRDKEPLTVAAKVVDPIRVVRDVSRFAVQFENLSADGEDAIEERIARSVEALRRPVALVASSVSAQAMRLARDMSALGYEAIRCATPLDLAWRMADDKACPDVVVMGDRPCGLDTHRLESFLAEASPSVACIVIRPVSRARRSTEDRSRARLVIEPATPSRLRVALRDVLARRSAR